MEYGGINAKIKALRGRLIKKHDYVELSRIKSDKELNNRLQDIHEYKQLIQGVTDEGRRYKIEQNVYLSLSDELNRIYTFINDYKIRRFLDSFTLDNEIRIIKILLCMIYDEREIDFSYHELMTLIGKSSGVDVNKILKSETTGELIESFKGTRFYGVFSEFYLSGTSLFELETRLDLYYYMQIKKSIKQNLKGINREIADKLIGVKIDLTNIVWIYRLKTYYKLDNSILYTYLVPQGYRLKRSHITLMAEAKNNEELIAEIQRGPYGNVFSNFSAGDGIERLGDRELIKLYASFDTSYPNSLAPTLAYLFYKELEIRNVISLIEGVRYELESDEILQYLILKPEHGG